MKNKTYLIPIIFVLLASPLTHTALAQEGLSSSILPEKKMITAIEVKGNRTIGASTILSKIKSRVGQEYLQKVVSEDLKRLYNTGFFADVSVDHEEVDGGFKIVFIVEEKSIIEDITFSKLRYFKPVALIRKLRSKKGQFLDNKVLNDDIQTIKDMYAKKGLTSVSVEVERDKDQLSNKVNLHFVIKEGSRVKVKRIVVEGNREFKSKRILRLIKSRAAWLLHAGYLKEDVLDEDMKRIKAFYEGEGFIDAKADYRLEKISDQRVKVIISIIEGQRYYVEDITVSGNRVLTTPEIREAMVQIKKGGIFSRERLSLDIANIRSLYFDRGYIFANVQDSTSLDAETGKVKIKLDIHEGEVAYIHKIRVEGNDRTRDMVIRRELRLYPGDRFDGAKMRRSKQRLKNLGYFESIGYDIADTDISNEKDLVVQVKEAKTGSLSFGGGYSTVDKVVGFLEVEQKNFDFTNWPTFTGGGQQLLARVEAGSTRNNMRLSFTEPWIFDYPVSGGFDVYLTERDRDSSTGYAYDEKRVGGALRLGKSLTEYISSSITYRYEKIKIGDFDTNVSADLLAEEGENKVSSLGLGLTRDTRDNVFSPTTGLYLDGSTDVAGGILGGTKDFYRVSGRGSYYIPLKFQSVIELRLRAGIVDSYGDSGSVPIFERFFAGGARTIRGYDERQVGPLDSVTQDPIGGESLLVGNVEYTIPLIDFLKLAAFYDIGRVWAKVEDIGAGDFKSGTGVGLRVKTPIGPMNLDYGYPLDNVPGDDGKGKFYFSVSRGF